MISRVRRPSTALAIIALLLLTRLAVAADEIKVMTSGAFTAAYLELAREFERSTGHRVVTEATSMGTGSTSIPARLDRGEAIDVVIVADGDLEQLIKTGHIRQGTRVDLARSAIGMAVRRGAPKPDISSVDALRRTLLEAKSSAYVVGVGEGWTIPSLLRSQHPGSGRQRGTDDGTVERRDRSGTLTMAGTDDGSRCHCSLSRTLGPV